jgi:hypothetical protein
MNHSVCVAMKYGFWSQAGEKLTSLAGLMRVQQTVNDFDTSITVSPAKKCKRDMKLAYGDSMLHGSCI